jgi:hypothetical protein
MSKEGQPSLIPDVGDAPTDYVRWRVSRLVGMGVGLVLTRAQAKKILECLDRTVTVDRVMSLSREASVFTETKDYREAIGKLLREFHPKRYEGSFAEQMMLKDYTASRIKYSLFYVMDVLLKECGYAQPRGVEERMDDAAYYAPKVEFPGARELNPESLN